jgi:hypothetical protein
MLANHAEIREGVAYVMSAGIDTVNATQLPATFNGALLLRMLLHRSEIDRPHMIDVRFTDEDGRRIAQVEGRIEPQKQIPDFPMGWEYPVMMAVNIAGMPLPRAGQYSVEILGDSNYLASLHLRVVLKPATQDQPPSS